MTFLKVIYGEQFARKIFFFKGACLFKTSKKIFSKEAYFSTDFAENLFRISQLELSSLKSSKFLYDIFLAFTLEKCNLNTDKTS